MPILAGLATPTLGADDYGTPAVESQWSGLSVTWTDYLGRTWDLNSSNDGAILAQGGVRGLGMPAFDRYSQVSPALAGSRNRGHRTKERDVFWPIFLWADTGSQQWIDRDQAWWSGMRPDVTGMWTIGTLDGGTRSLPLRFVDDGDPSFDVDPVLRGWYVYGITLVAEQPYWQGPAIERAWRVISGENWMSPSSGVFGISSGASIETATASNPGDVDSWPIWTVTGPVNAASLGIGGGTVAHVDPIGAGVSVVIDTRPDRMTATRSDGVDVSASVSWSPLPVPPGSTVETAITLTSPGTGATASLSLTPLYYRAW